MHSLISTFYPDDLINDFVAPFLQALVPYIDKAIQDPQEAKSLV